VGKTARSSASGDEILRYAQDDNNFNDLEGILDFSGQLEHLPLTNAFSG
jgi:hypothetical protein